MRLSELIKGLNPERITDDREIKGLANDSRRIKEGHLFFAVKGSHFDGNEFIENAIKNGAFAVISENSLMKNYTVPTVQVKDIYTAMARIADRFYGHPSGTLKLVGITGTNGKTTTTYLVHNILNNSDKRTGLIGTIHYLFGTERVKASFTTPEAVDFQRLLKEMSEAGMTHVVTEVSSHALALRRVDNTDFDVSVFTNLTRDHLDFHGNMEEYYMAKAQLFLELTGYASVINIDDIYGKRLIDELSAKDIEIITYGLSNNADLRAVDIREHPSGLDFSVKYRNESASITSDLVGLINVYNILSAIGVSILLGIKLNKTIEGIRNFSGIKGRMESIRAGQDFLAIVDYAHTPDALKKVLHTLRLFTKGNVITVFGCGGNRDRGKRPEMGMIASELSDTVIVTSDNPRKEDPEEIISDITGGIKKDNYMAEIDRREAIYKAVHLARHNDVILVAGKGHEDYQEVNGIKYPFSDRETLKEAIQRAGDYSKLFTDHYKK